MKSLEEVSIFNEFVIYNNEIADVHSKERILGASHRVAVLKACVKDPKHNEEGSIGESERVGADG